MGEGTRSRNPGRPGNMWGAEAGETVGTCRSSCAPCVDKLGFYPETAEHWGHFLRLLGVLLCSLESFERMEEVTGTKKLLHSVHF